MSNVIALYKLLNTIITAALKHGIQNSETETEMEKEMETETEMETEIVKGGSKESIWKKKIAMTKK